MKASKLKPHQWNSVAAIALAIFAVTTALPGGVLCDEKAAAGEALKEAPVATQPTSTATKPKLRENSYYYGAFNRRDPFRSLVDGRFVRNDMMERIELTAVELVGVVRGDLDRFALLEDEKGFSYILRVGDKVRNGTVVAIGEQTMTARITNFGQTSKYTLHLVERQKGDKR